MTIQRINNGNGHWYKLDGTKAEGVTTLIGGGVPKPALVGWAARKVAEYAADNIDELNFVRSMGRDAIVDLLKGKPFRDRNDAAVRGTKVHGYAEKLALGEDVDVPPELAPYVQSCAAFLDDFEIKPVFRELVVANRQHRYCGTLDLIANQAIWDYKTAASGIYGETALQLAAYLKADTALIEGVEHTFESLADAFDIRHAFAVWLRPDGYDVLPLDVSETTFELFLAAAHVARGTAKSKTSPGISRLVGDPISPEARQ